MPRWFPVYVGICVDRKERETGRQKDKKTEKQREIKTERQKNRKTK